MESKRCFSRALLLLAAFFHSVVARTLQSTALPFVVLHGIGDACSNPGMSHFVDFLSEESGAYGTCIEIGNGGPDSWTMHLNKQVDEVCRQVKAMEKLQSGFNLVGLSQGNVIGRGYIEYCDGGPPVHNFVSLGGPHAGTASVPECVLRPICKLIDIVLELGIYSKYVQDHIAPAGYVKIPVDLDAYRKGCTFLPRLNNELASKRNSTYTTRFSALHQLVLIMFEEDTVLLPAQTAWFGYFAPHTFDVILQPNETELYKEDWIGLKALDEGGRVNFIAVPGNHLTITRHVVQSHILPYINNNNNNKRFHTPAQQQQHQRQRQRKWQWQWQPHSNLRSRGGSLLLVDDDVL